MRWLLRMLAGPLLWAVLFAMVYALHGIGCAWDWPMQKTPIGALHPLLMRLIWIAGLLLHLLMILRPTDYEPRARQLIRMGDWIGLIASLVSLLPLMISSSCEIPGN